MATLLTILKRTSSTKLHVNFKLKHRQNKQKNKETETDNFPQHNVRSSNNIGLGRVKNQSERQTDRQTDEIV